MDARIHPARNTALAIALVVIALLACKKKSDDTAETASAAPPPPPPVSATAEPPPSAAADADAATTPTPTATTFKVVTHLDGGVKDAAAPDAGSTASTADLKSIQACCASLGNEAKKAGTYANKYKSAAGVCNGIAEQVKSGKANAAAARTQIRALIQGAPTPAGC